jgi:hypothetical protein
MKLPEDDQGNDQAILMLAYLCITKEAEASLERKVEILDRFGLTNRQIAKVCGAALQSVRNARVTVRRKKRK